MRSSSCFFPKRVSIFFAISFLYWFCISVMFFFWVFSYSVTKLIAYEHVISSKNTLFVCALVQSAGSGSFGSLSQEVSSSLSLISGSGSHSLKSNEGKTKRYKYLSISSVSYPIDDKKLAKSIFTSSLFPYSFAKEEARLFTKSLLKYFL